MYCGEDKTHPSVKNGMVAVQYGIFCCGCFVCKRLFSNAKIHNLSLRAITDFTAGSIFFTESLCISVFYVVVKNE